jgi:hypothetical protein
MMITPAQIRVSEDHRQDLLAIAARVRLVATARSVPAPAPRPAGRVRAGLRQAVAALAALTAIG